MNDEKKDDIKVAKATNPVTGEKYAIAHSVLVQERMYKISLLLLVATIVVAVLLTLALWKFFPFILKIDQGNWLSRLVLTCRECAACI